MKPRHYRVTLTVDLEAASDVEAARRFRTFLAEPLPAPARDHYLDVQSLVFYNDGENCRTVGRCEIHPTIGPRPDDLSGGGQS
jgi:hypothetical protein